MNCRTDKNWNTRGGQLFDVVRREMDDFVNLLSDPKAWTDDQPAFSPRTDFAETDTQYEIMLDLPGMSSGDFSVEVHEGKLSISGERVRGEIVEGTEYHRVERRYGKFNRLFALGHDVNVESISADYKDGVLTVVVPKSEKAKPKKINVNVQS